MSTGGPQGEDVRIEGRSDGALLITGIDAPALTSMLREGGLTVAVSPRQTVDAAARLSDRELEILRHIADGLSNAEIARLAGLSVNTIKSHIRSAYRKIEVETRAQAVRWSCRHQLDQPHPTSGP